MGACICDVQYKSNPSLPLKGRYIAQTSRTLYERSLQHMKFLRYFEIVNFMFKHWSIHHKDSEKPPQFDFRVLKCNSDPLSRLIHESVKICSGASMNSKSEHVGYRVPRLKVEQTDKQTLKDIEASDSVNKLKVGQMQEIIDRSMGLGLFKSKVNNMSLLAESERCLIHKVTCQQQAGKIVNNRSLKNL